MGAKISKRYPSYKSQPKVFKLFLNFLPNGSHKTTFGVLKIEILMNLLSLTWDSMGAKISKCYSSYKLQAKVFKLLLIFFSMVLTKLHWDFWNWNFIEFIALLDYSQAEGYSMGLMASHTFFFSNQLSLKIPGDNFHKSYLYEFQIFFKQIEI